MSLLNDALKRAKLEALEREAADRKEYGLPTLRAPRRRRWAVIGAALLGLLLLALAGAGVGWMLARGGGPPGADQAAAEEAAVAAQAATSSSPEVTASPSEPTAHAAIVGAADPQAEPEGEQPSESLAGATPPGDQADDPEAQLPSESGTAPTPSRLMDGASYVRALEFNGGRLELQGIAFHGASSVAIINGLMVAPDDMVGGFLVVAIEPERVQLQGRGVTIYLTLHPAP